MRLIRRIILLILFFTLYLFFSNTISTPLKVVSRSMEPGLNPSDRVLYSRILLEADSSLKLGIDFGISHGDLLVISPPYYRNNQKLIDMINPIVRFFTFQKMQLSSYSRYSWENSHMIKRVVALPGDTVRIRDHKVYIKSPGEKNFRIEQYDRNPELLMDPILKSWSNNYPLSGDYKEYKLEEDEYFVLSDNRGTGSDSMAWGPLSRDHILGKVFFRYWPFSDFSFL